MITAGEIYDYIDSFAPFETAMNFDNAGLLIGSRNMTSENVLLSLDVTTDVINEAAEKNIGIIISHHPIIFNPIKSISAESVQYLAAKNNIAVISAHTNLDIAKNGVNDSLAAAIGIVSENGTNDDCMLIGELENEFTSYDFAVHIKSVINCRGLRYTKRNGLIKKAAVACGAGGSSIFNAVKNGADAIITGEIKHHEILFAIENNVSVYDLGHFQSEDLIINILAKKLSEHFKETIFEKAESDTDRVFYI